MYEVFASRCRGLLSLRSQWWRLHKRLRLDQERAASEIVDGGILGQRPRTGIDLSLVNVRRAARAIEARRCLGTRVGQERPIKLSPQRCIHELINAAQRQHQHAPHGSDDQQKRASTQRHWLASCALGALAHLAQTISDAPHSVQDWWLTLTFDLVAQLSDLRIDDIGGNRGIGRERPDLFE
jgi:hypothetical protein